MLSMESPFGSWSSNIRVELYLQGKDEGISTQMGRVLPELLVHIHWVMKQEQECSCSCYKLRLGFGFDNSGQFARIVPHQLSWLDQRHR